jgi:biotin carboxylase
MEVIWVLPDGPGDDDAMPRLLRRLGPVVDIAGMTLDEAARELGRHRPDGIITFVDDHLLMAAALAARLDLRYHTPDVAAVLADKRRQREALERAGIPGPRYWPVPADITPAELDQLADRVQYPSVLKHARGSGSRDMHPVGTPHALRELLEARPPMGAIDRLLEEYLPDDVDHDPRFASYVSVESVVSSGQARHVAVTGRFPLADPFRETGNFIPGILAVGMRGPVLSMVADAIEALGIRTAVVHTEVKLTPEGPRLIEVNGRLGARPPFILQRVSRVNLFLEACLLAVGLSSGVVGPVECSGVGFWFMIQPPVWARRVGTIDGLNQLAEGSGVETVTINRRPGESVDWREGTDGHVLTIRGRVEDHEILAGTIEFIRQTVQLDYE